MTALHYAANTDETATDVATQKQIAVRLLLDAFSEAELEGVAADCMAQAALFIALKEFVLAYGEEPVAKFTEKLPKRLRNGEFTVQRHG